MTGPAPAAGEVQLWRAGLDPDPELLGWLADLLDARELGRARQFRFDRDRTRFVAAHGWLRLLLGRLLGLPPAVLSFTTAPGGKPQLAHPSLHWLRFNLSHSADLALFAVARDRAVGVDVEQVSAELDVEAVAERFFTPGERRELAGLPRPARQTAGFGCWTRKEAYLKGLGVGLVERLDELDVPTRPNGSGWVVLDVDAGPGFAAALATAGVPSLVRPFRSVEELLPPPGLLNRRPLKVAVPVRRPATA